MSMPLADLIFLAFALSVDAFVVAFSYGLLIKQKRLSNGIKLSLSTGAGQFLMPVLGFLLTGSVRTGILRLGTTGWASPCSPSSGSTSSAKAGITATKKRICPTSPA